MRVERKPKNWHLYKHGLSNTPVYRVWRAMIARCTYPSQACYKYYGGRGISICERWKNFDSFLEDMGIPKPGQSIDRINNDGNYEPMNCRWVGWDQQANNKSTSRRVSIDGESKTISEWARTSGVSQGTIWRRIDEGWPVREAVFEATNPNRPKIYGKTKMQQTGNQLNGRRK